MLSIYIYISTLHHLIHVWTNPVPSHLHKYQPCTILSMFISNPASFYPCIIHPAFKVSSQSDKNVPQKHHLYLNFHTSNLTAVLKTWQGHHSILLMNRQSMTVYRYAELLIPTVCRENSSQRFHQEQPLQLKRLITPIPRWKAAGFNSGHKKKVRTLHTKARVRALHTALLTSMKSWQPPCWFCWLVYMHVLHCCKKGKDGERRKSSIPTGYTLPCKSAQKSGTVSRLEKQWVRSMTIFILE